MGKFEIIKSDKGIHFNLKANNHKVILTSEIYKSKASAEIGVSSVKLNAKVRSRFSELKSKNDMDYFTLKAANGEVIGLSQMYKSQLGLKNGITSVKTNAPTAEITYIGFGIESDKVGDLSHISPLDVPSIIQSYTSTNDATNDQLIDAIVATNTTDKKVSNDAVVSPKLKKRENVISRIIQRISRVFVGNV